MRVTLYDIPRNMICCIVSVISYDVLCLNRDMTGKAIYVCVGGDKYISCTIPAETGA